MLLFWALCSFLSAPDATAAKLPLWITALTLSPYIIVPAFLLLFPRTAEQWRELMIAVYAGLSALTLLNLFLPVGADWGDLPISGQYGSIVLPGRASSWLIALPRFSGFWGLLIYGSLPTHTPRPVSRRCARIWWGALCLAPINTGLIGYMDLLAPLPVLAAVLLAMNLINKAGRAE